MNSEVKGTLTVVVATVITSVMILMTGNTSAENSENSAQDQSALVDVGDNSGQSIQIHDSEAVNENGKDSILETISIVEITTDEKSLTALPPPGPFLESKTAQNNESRSAPEAPKVPQVAPVPVAPVEPSLPVMKNDKESLAKEGESTQIEFSGKKPSLTSIPPVQSGEKRDTPDKPLAPDFGEIQKEKPLLNSEKPSVEPNDFVKQMPSLLEDAVQTPVKPEAPVEVESKPEMPVSDLKKPDLPQPELMAPKMDSVNINKPELTIQPPERTTEPGDMKAPLPEKAVTLQKPEMVERMAPKTPQMQKKPDFQSQPMQRPNISQPVMPKPPQWGNQAQTRNPVHTPMQAGSRGQMQNIHPYMQQRQLRTHSWTWSNQQQNNSTNGQLQGGTQRGGNAGNTYPNNTVYPKQGGGYYWTDPMMQQGNMHPNQWNNWYVPSYQMPNYPQMPNAQMGNMNIQPRQPSNLNPPLTQEKN